MGLDTTQLKIVISGDNEVLSHAAGVLLPVMEQGNLLLCTFLLGNLTVNTLSDITNGTIGFLMSTGLLRVVDCRLCFFFSPGSHVWEV